MKDKRKFSEVLPDIHLIAEYFHLKLSYASHYHFAVEVEGDMRLKINQLLYVAL